MNSEFSKCDKSMWELHALLLNHTYSNLYQICLFGTVHSTERGEGRFWVAVRGIIGVVGVSWQLKLSEEYHLMEKFFNPDNAFKVVD